MLCILMYFQTVAVDTHTLHITQFFSVVSVCDLKASGGSGGIAPGHT